MKVTELRDALRHFAAERDWERFHSPKNLAMALTAEAAELVEHFQWRSQPKPEALDEIGQELADVLIYLVRLADRLEIDLLAAAERKMALNAQRFPPQSGDQ
jgi:NTP pyrophosphatase (non-canonical NTP hydrolase)